MIMSSPVEISDLKTPIIGANPNGLSSHEENIGGVSLHNGSSISNSQEVQVNDPAFLSDTLVDEEDEKPDINLLNSKIAKSGSSINSLLNTSNERDMNSSPNNVSTEGHAENDSVVNLKNNTTGHNDRDTSCPHGLVIEMKKELVVPETEALITVAQIEERSLSEQGAPTIHNKLDPTIRNDEILENADVAGEEVTLNDISRELSELEDTDNKESLNLSTKQCSVETNPLHIRESSSVSHLVEDINSDAPLYDYCKPVITNDIDIKIETETNSLGVKEEEDIPILPGHSLCNENPPDVAKSETLGEEAPKACDEQSDRMETSGTNGETPKACDEQSYRMETSDTTGETPKACDELSDGMETSGTNGETPKACDEQSDGMETSDTTGETPKACDELPDGMETSGTNGETPEACDEHSDKMETSDTNGETPKACDDLSDGMETPGTNGETPKACDELSDRMETSGTNGLKSSESSVPSMLGKRPAKEHDDEPAVKRVSQNNLDDSAMDQGQVDNELEEGDVKRGVSHAEVEPPEISCDDDVQVNSGKSLTEQSAAIRIEVVDNIQDVSKSLQQDSAPNGSSVRQDPLPSKESSPDAVENNPTNADGTCDSHDSSIRQDPLPSKESSPDAVENNPTNADGTCDEKGGLTNDDTDGNDCKNDSEDSEHSSRTTDRAVGDSNESNAEDESNASSESRVRASCSSSNRSSSSSSSSSSMKKGPTETQRVLTTSDDEDEDDPSSMSDSVSEGSSEGSDESHAPSDCKAPKTPVPVLSRLRKGSLKGITKTDLEELMVQKLCECISDRCDVGELRRRCQNLEIEVDKWKERYLANRKQMNELAVVIQKFYADKASVQFPSPVRVTRSVGLQVSIGNKIDRATAAALKSTSSTSPEKVQRSPLKPPIAIKSTRPPPPKAATTAAPKKLAKPQNTPKPPTTPNPVVKPPTTPKPVVKQPSTPKSVAKPATTSVLVVKTPNTPKPNQAPSATQRQSPASLITMPPLTPAPSVNAVADVIDLSEDDESPATHQMTQRPAQTNFTPANPANSQGKILQVLTTSAAQNQGNRVAYLLPTSQVNSRQVSIANGRTQSQETPPPLVYNRAATGPIQQYRGPALPPGVTANSATSPGGPWALRHPAPLPNPPAHQALDNSLNLRPPRPTLKITIIASGIVLSWDMIISPEHETIASYQLVAYQEGSNPPHASLWKRVGDVKALPLPMACTLTQFVPGHKYHFAVRAVDIRARVGQYSYPGTILLVK